MSLLDSDIPAIGFLLAAGACVAVWMACAAQRSSCSWAQAPLYFVGYIYTRVIWRAKVVRPLRLPEDQGAILVCNHTSSIDPMLLRLAAGRKIHWMIAREFTEHWFWGPVVNLWEVIPASRGGVDTSATRAAIRIAAAGGLIGLFPEGRINFGDEFMLPARPGAVVIAERAGVPVVPCYIDSAPFDRYPQSPFFMRASVRIHMGEPHHVGGAGRPVDIKTEMKTVLRKIALLAGRGDFEPRLAGKHWKPSREETLRAMEESARRRRAQAS